MSDKLNKCLIRKNIITEINEGFPQFILFTIPLDLSYNSIISTEEKVKEINIDLTDNIGLNYSSNNLMNVNFISSDDDSFSSIHKKEISQDEIETNKSSKSNSRFSNIFNEKNEENNNSFKSILNKNYIKENQNLNIKEEEGKKEDRSFINIINNYKEIKPIQNYNINIYNPHINCVNISYPTFSVGPCSSFSRNYDDINNKEKSMRLDEKGIINGEYNIYYENNEDINSILSNRSLKNINNDISFLFNKLEDNFPCNYPKTKFEQNLIFNNNKNTKDNNIKNKNEKEKNDINSNENKNPKNKKNKKKKKKKIDDEYTVEMFGRRGWICEGCSNFNYESRKNCNRCKIPKKPLKKTLIMDNKGNKIIDKLSNTNHKDDWNCYNCGNINYAFRLNCNRCQIKREISQYNNEKNKK